jgi:hypothetical protein
MPQMKDRFTEQELLDIKELCKAELAKPDSQYWPDFAMVTLHATGVLRLIRDFEGAVDACSRVCRVLSARVAELEAEREARIN